LPRENHCAPELQALWAKSLGVNCAELTIKVLEASNPAAYLSRVQQGNGMSFSTPKSSRPNMKFAVILSIFMLISAIAGVAGLLDIGKATSDGSQSRHQSLQPTQFDLPRPTVQG
jgi:hypothetical protein